MTRLGGIRRQLQWLGVIPALIMLILVLVSLTWQRFQDADNEVRQLGGFLAQQLAGSAEYGVLSGNLSDLRRQANMVLARPDVQYVQFRDQDGEPLLRAGSVASARVLLKDLAAAALDAVHAQRRLGHWPAPGFAGHYSLAVNEHVAGAYDLSPVDRAPLERILEATP